MSWNDLWLTNIQNNVWCPDSSSKMTANTVNRLIQWHLPEKVFMKFRSQIENQVSDYRLLWASSLAHLTQRVRWAIVTTERPSVNFSYFNQLFWSHWANLNQALVEWSLDGPLPNCVWWSRLPTKMATKLKIEKRGDEILIVHCCFSVSQNELVFGCVSYVQNIKWNVTCKSK